MATPDEDGSKSPLTSATPYIEEKLVGDEQTNELYLFLTSTVVRKRKQQRLNVPLDFNNNLTKETLVDSGAFVSADVQNVLDTIKQKAAKNVFKINNSRNFQMQIAIGQLEKSLATVTLKFDIGDNTFAEYFVIMEKLTGPII